MTKKTTTLKVPLMVRIVLKILLVFSDKWTAKYALKLFITPVKFPTPLREIPTLSKLKCYSMNLPRCKKEIVVYESKNASKNALVIHGWNGRGTQLFSVIELLETQGYKVICFDAPGHGKSKKNKTQMLDFIEAVFVLEQQYGGFDLIVGHSLGGMTLFNALGRGVSSCKAIAISSGDEIIDILDNYVNFLKLPSRFSGFLRDLFENYSQDKIENYSAHVQAEKIKIPVLVIHDKNDMDVSYKAAENIVNHLPQGKLHLTHGLGHRKILGDSNVIQIIKNFIAH